MRTHTLIESAAPRQQRVEWRWLSRGSDGSWALGLGLVGFLALSPGLLWGLPAGKTIVNGLRILHGDLPYRDFWTMYAPGQFYLVAALFWAFGTHIWVQGVAVLALVSIGAAVFFTFLRGLGLPRGPAAILAAMYIVMFWGTAPEMSTYEPAMVLLLLALVQVSRHIRGGGAAPLWFAGLLCGVAAWFKHDVSFYVCAGVSIGLTASWILLRHEGPRAGLPPWKTVPRLGAGAVVSLLPVAVLVAWAAGSRAWTDLIAFPATTFPLVFGEPFPAPWPDLARLIDAARSPIDLGRLLGVTGYLSSWLLCWVPFWVFAVGAVTTIGRRRRAPGAVSEQALVLLACMPFFWSAAHVQKNTHLYSLAILSMSLGAMAWARSGISSRPRVVRATLLATLVLLGVGLAQPPAVAVADVVYHWRGHRQIDFPPVRGIRVKAAEYDVFNPLVSLVRARTSPDEPIYVGLGRHDSIVISDQRPYYLAERQPATRYNELHSGISDRAATQREMAEGLDRLATRCVVLWHFGWSRQTMDAILARRRARVPDVGATALDAFLRQQFSTIGSWGEYEVRWRDRPPIAGEAD